MVDHPRQPRRPAAPRQAPSPPERSPERSEDGGERVAKALARAGVASRREVERLIGEGRVALNGRVLDTPAVKVGAGDILTVDGQVAAAAEPTRLWRYHKPAGLLTANRDPKGRPTVFERLPEGMPRVISVGRLDLNSEGLLLLTNDGALARALELPSNGWVRRYRARAYGRCSQPMLDRLKEGITVEGVVYGPIEARLDKAQHRSSDEAGGKDLHGPANVWITLSLTEGKNREVRRVLEALGLKVNRLLRLAYGPFALGTLEIGAVEEVGPRVIREQLADVIAPQNLPSGNTTSSPRNSAPAVSRRGPAVSRSPSAPLRSTDPRAREGDEPPKARGERLPGTGGPEKPTYKPGWAKPKPKVRSHPPPRTGAKPESDGAGPGAVRKSDRPNPKMGKPPSRSRAAKPRGGGGRSPR